MMKASVLTCLCFFFCLFVQIYRGSCQERAAMPPRGWNSYDSFSWTISEEEFLENARRVALRLRPHGYEYVVADYLWYRKRVAGAGNDSYLFDNIDRWGRPIPDPMRWPSSENGTGFTQIAQKVHRMGLKFGIHVMRGLSMQAFDANYPILDVTTGRAYEEGGRIWLTKEIGVQQRVCAWMPHGFMSVNTNLGAGRAFLRSLYQQYADWGVDFVKHDCVFGGDLDIEEISYVSEVLKGLNRPILYSLSPGTGVTPAMAGQVQGKVNMYRVTGDEWDHWGDVQAHFDISRDMASDNMIGGSGLLGKSWPDLDMLPLGWLTEPGANRGPHRKTNLNPHEQRSQMTLWSMAKSPLMFGGDVRKLDSFTLRLITHPVLLEINSYSLNNKEFTKIVGTLGGGKKREKSKASSRESLALTLMNCACAEADSWSSAVNPKRDRINKLKTKALAKHSNPEQICWREEGTFQSPFCLYIKNFTSTQDTEEDAKGQSGWKVQLTATAERKKCLEGSAIKRLNARENHRITFSPCKEHSNQIWKLHDNGTLLNQYNTMCGVVRKIKAHDGDIDDTHSDDIRSWIATGRQGEIYVAFFNLSSRILFMSARVSDVLMAVPGSLDPKVASCGAREIWTGKFFEEVRRIISTPVAPHGVALFVLHCL